jgi:hypothetical protein
MKNLLAPLLAMHASLALPLASEENPESSPPSIPWVAPTDAPDWVPIGGGTVTESPWETDPASDGVARSGKGYGVDPGHHAPQDPAVTEPELIVGMIVQEVHWSYDYRSCTEYSIDSDGDGVNETVVGCGFAPKSNGEEVYYEYMWVSEEHTAANPGGSLTLDTFRLPKHQEEGRSSKMVGRAKFIPADKANEGLMDDIQYWDGWNHTTHQGTDQIKVPSTDFSSGSFPNSRNPPPGRADNFGGAGVNMSEHSVAIFWRDCKTIPECRKYFAVVAY